MCQAVRKGIKQQLQLDEVKIKEALNLFICNLYGHEDNDKENIFWDSVNGGWLPRREVHEARMEEMEYVRKMNVYSRVPWDESKRVTGRNPIKLRWVDTRKSTGEIRSRLVAKEYRIDSRPEMFSATPPLEAMKLLISIIVSAQVHPEDWGQWKHAEWRYTARGRGVPKEAWADDMVTALHVDVSRAYFHAPSKEAKYIEIPTEDWNESDEKASQCGKLNVSL